MKILLTGANGFLGNYLKNELKKSFVLKTLSRSSSDYNIDLLNKNILFNDKFDLVIHAAGKAHLVPSNEKEFNDFYETNVNGTLNLLEGLRVSGLPQKFVFISSVSVYGLSDGFFINENSPLLANDAYGKSKIEAEKIIINWCKQYNVKYTILRLPLIIGSDPPGNLKTMISAIKKGYYFNIAGGIAKKSMVLAKDIARFIISSSDIGGIYNLTDGIHPSFNDLSKIISLKLNKRYPINMPKILALFLAKLGDVIGGDFPLNTIKYIKITSTLTFDDSKARKAFFWNPDPVLENLII